MVLKAGRSGGGLRKSLEETEATQVALFPPSTAHSVLVGSMRMRPEVAQSPQPSQRALPRDPSAESPTASLSRGRLVETRLTRADHI